MSMLWSRVLLWLNVDPTQKRGLSLGYIFGAIRGLLAVNAPPSETLKSAVTRLPVWSDAPLRQWPVEKGGSGP